MQYRPDIDGLRAIAVIFVVLFHAFPGILPGGFIGVDIFFVISGYLITGVILANMQKDSFSFLNFYKRRILRIFPALIIVLAACCFAGFFLFWPNEYEALGRHVAGGTAFMANILLYFEMGYFDAAAHAKPLLNLWSLGIEEQFYFIYPLILWACCKLRRLAAPGMALLCILSFADNIYMAFRHPDADFYLPLSRFWELLAGSCLQMLQHQNPCQTWAAARSGFLQCFLPVCGLSCLAAGALLCKSSSYPGFMALLPVAAATAIIASGQNGFFNRVVLAKPVCVFTGRISYTLYLWHWPLLSFTYIILGRPAYENAWAVRLFLVAAAFALATLTYKYVEMPVRFGPFLGRKKVACLAGGMFLVGMLGVAIWLTGGMPARMADRAREMYSQLSLPPTHDAACLEYAGAKEKDYFFCRYAPAHGNQTIALLGDSHAHAAFSGLARLGAEMGFNTLLLGRIPERTDSLEEIKQQKERMLKLLARKQEIKTVVIIFRGNHYLMARHNPGDRKNFALPTRDYADLEQEFVRFLEQITALGKSVLLVEDNPDLNADINDALPRKLPFGEYIPQFSHTPVREARERQTDALKLLRRLERIPGVTLAGGTLDAFCPGQDCLLFNEKGIPLYYDDDHLSYAGSDMLARKILRPALEKGGF